MNWQQVPWWRHKRYLASVSSLLSCWIITHHHHHHHQFTWIHWSSSINNSFIHINNEINDDQVHPPHLDRRPSMCVDIGVGVGICGQPRCIQIANRREWVVIASSWSSLCLCLCHCGCIFPFAIALHCEISHSLTHLLLSYSTIFESNLFKYSTTSLPSYTPHSNQPYKLSNIIILNSSSPRSHQQQNRTRLTQGSHYG